MNAVSYIAQVFDRMLHRSRVVVSASERLMWAIGDTQKR